ncbi:CLCA_X family protein [Motilimonas cestriensis]|uniref:CLCA_X family protein n=1 Tax=Motilimonas cestriensis TaxID=2742685 RepID=UPI003DA5D355
MLGSMRLSRLHQTHYRNGPDYRNQADVSFQDIQHAFAFSTIKIGRWVSKEEQQIAANLIFDALFDLATILNLPSQALGLKGQLNLAFGTGGQAGVQAHYAPYSRTLALAKNAGAGALAHEFWHAFDHYITDKVFTPPHYKFASDTWLNKNTLIAHPLNQALAQCFKIVLLSESGQAASAYTQAAIALDKQLNQLYYSRPTELMARAFEAFVQDHSSITNRYLVAGTQQTELAKAGIYPLAQHREAIAQGFKLYFYQLGFALKKSSQ